MIDQGVDGICILANYSEQFLLTDGERATLVDLCLAHVAGRVPRADIPSVMRSARVLVCASKRTWKWEEQFGFVLAEAMASGTPVIGAANAGYRTVLTGPGASLLVPPTS